MKIEELKRKLLEIAYIARSISIIEWDQNIYMPKGAYENRAEWLAFMNGIHHEKYTSEEFSNLLAELIDIDSGKLKHETLSKLERAMVVETWKDWKKEKALPEHFVREYSATVAKAFSIWETAKKEGKFSSFAPILNEVVKRAKEKAGYIMPGKPVYDALIDEFEPGMTSQRLTEVFGEIKGELISIVGKIRESKKSFIDLGKAFWPAEQQKSFVSRILDGIQFDSNYGRIDISEHPFCDALHPTDVRITMRIKENDPMFAILAAIHEAGHGLYEMGLDKAWFGTPVGMASSMGVHESQSRLYETRIGLCKAYWEYYFPILKSYFPEQLENISIDDFYNSINQIEPGYIRIEADEVTYILHVIIRFEMERLILESEIDINELPGIWNAKYKEYLGITPGNDSDGILQDVHWSNGLFGYFPSYALGTIYATQIFEKIEEDIPGLETEIKNGNFKPIRKWLSEKIHIKGRSISPAQLVEEATGSKISAKPFITYIKKKYGEIYGVSF